MVTAVTEPGGSTGIDISDHRPPEADSEELSVDQGSQLTTALPVSQADGDPLEYGLANSGAGPSHGSVVFNADGTFTYTPDEGFTSSDSFQYAATDDLDGVSSTGTVDIDVNPIPVDTGPVFDTSAQITRISVPDPQPPGAHADAFNAIGPSISADGRYVAFIGSDELPGEGDNHVGADIYLYDRLSDTVTSLTDSEHIGNAPSDESYDSLPSISFDGRFVVFTGQHEVTGTDVNGCPFEYTQNDTYLYNVAQDTVRLISGLQGSDPKISGGGDFIVECDAFNGSQLADLRSCRGRRSAQ